MSGRWIKLNDTRLRVDLLGEWEDQQTIIACLANLYDVKNIPVEDDEA